MQGALYCINIFGGEKSAEGLSIVKSTLSSYVAQRLQDVAGFLQGV
jgi:hypothetical protein